MAELPKLWVNIFGIDDVEIGDNPIVWPESLPVPQKGDVVRLKGVEDLQVISRILHPVIGETPVVDLFVGYASPDIVR